MRMLIGLSVVVMMGASLVSSRGVDLMPHGLITEIDPIVEKDLNTLDDLVRELTAVKHDVDHMPIYVEHALESLQRMKDDKVELVPGVTVAQLIEQNKFNRWSDCSKEALHERAELLRKFEPTVPEQLAVFEYLAKNLVNSAVMCAAHPEEIDNRLNDDDWLGGLMRIASDHVQKRFKEGAETVLRHIYDYVMQDGARFAHKRYRIHAPVKHNADKEEEEEEAKEQVDQPEPEPAKEPASESEGNKSS